MKSRRLFYFIIAALLLISISIAVLMQSRAVMQWVWQKVEYVTRGAVTAQRVDGVLAGPIAFEGLLIRLPSTEIELPDAHFDWHAGRLLAGRISIIEAGASEVVVTVHPAKEKKPKSDFNGVSAPLTLLADEVSVKRLVIRVDGAEDILLEDILVEDAEWRGDRLRVDKVALGSPWGTLSAQGYFATRTDVEVDLTTLYKPNPAWFDAPLELSGEVGGTLGKPNFSQRISGAANGHIAGTVEWAPGPLHWQAVADIDPFSIQIVRSNWRALNVGGHFEGSGDFRSNVLRGNLTLGDRALGNWRGNFALKQTLGQIEIDKAVLQGDGHPAWIEGHGKLRLVSAPDYVTDAGIDLRWRDIVWPVDGHNEKVRSSEGTAHLSGALNHYRLTTDLALAAPGYPWSHWQVEGEGDLRHFASPAVTLQGLDGQASGSASIRWSPHLEWQAQLAGKGLNPGRQWPQWPGKLDIDISSDGRWEKAHQLNIDVQSVKGTLRGYPLSGKGRADYLDKQWSLAGVHLTSGSAAFSANGTLASPWGVEWQLDAPQLSHLLPQARGQLHANGKITGEGKQPRILVDALVTGTKWNSYRLKQANLSADIDLAAQNPWQLRFNADHLAHEDQLFATQITVQGDGNAASHRLALGIERDDGRFMLTADGAYLDETWQGTLRDGVWTAAGGEGMRQESPATFRITRSQQTLSPFCWKDGEARGCVEYQPADAGGGELTASLTRLPVQMLTQWLPRKDVRFDGKIFAEGRARFNEGLRLLNLDAHVEAGALHYQHPLGRVIDLQFKRFNVSMRSESGSSNTVADMALGNGDTMHLEGRLPGWSAGMPLQGNQPVEGAAVLSMRDLAWMTLVVPEILDPKGVVTANLVLGGTAADPRLTGTLALSDGTVSIPRAGLNIRQLALAARSTDGVSLRLSGAATSGPGWMTVEGSVRGESLDKWRSEFLLRGDRFEAVRLPSVNLLASPQITAVIEPNRLDVSGTIYVPQADIKLPEFPDTVRSSPDVVLINSEQPIPLATRWAINSRLTLRLGDYIRLEGYGFKGRIAGQLTVTEKPESVATGQGELVVHEGRYKAYGQDLIIDNGRLLFAHSPLDNPALDVRASRSLEEVKVGVDITGRLQRPELRLFSEPAMEESDALAYLVLGRPLRTASSRDATAVSAAATSLGLVGGDRIARIVGDEFGIDEVTVGSEYKSQDAALLLGKYLSPRLYLQYAVVFSDALNVTRLRYELTNHWYIKAESGEQQAVDILYTFER